MLVTVIGLQWYGIVWYSMVWYGIALQQCYSKCTVRHCKVDVCQQQCQIPVHRVSVGSSADLKEFAGIESKAHLAIA